MLSVITLVAISAGRHPAPARYVAGIGAHGGFAIAIRPVRHRNSSGAGGERGAVAGTAAQRVELLKAQQSAANEISKLVHRLDELQLPPQRLSSGEAPVKRLGNEETTYQVAGQTAAPAEPEHKNGQNGAPLTTDKHEEPVAVDVSSLLAEGQSLLDDNEPEKALQCFDTILAALPEHAETLIKKGGALERIGRLDEAVASYDRAIAADGTMTIAYLHKGGVVQPHGALRRGDGVLRKSAADAGEKSGVKNS